jgi:hypothetical protein
MKKGEILNLDWLNQLPQNDPATLLEVAIEKIRRLDLYGPERLLWLFSVDDALRSPANALLHQFADARRLSAEDEIRFWEAGRIYHDLIANSLASLLGNITNKSIPAEEAPNIITRALFHRGLSALWRHLRYIPFPEGWWLETHKLYTFAEREQISNTEVKFTAPLSPSYPTAQYLQLLLVDTPNRSNMTRHQIVALSEWLEKQTDGIALENTFDEESQLFFVNLDEDKAGSRIRNFEPSPSCRYWRTDSLIAEIELELEKSESGQAPAIDADLLRQIHVEWSRTGYKRQRRNGERNEVQKKASVAHGIYAVCQEVHSQALGSTHLSLEGETWVIENESPNGFGALVSAELNAWLKIGRLMTLREELNFGMSEIAVIRSLQHREGGRVYVGAEVLSYMGLYAQLQDWPSNGAQPYPGLFLASDAERGLPSSLIIPAIEYQPDGELRLKLDRRLRLIKPGKLMERKDDWCRVAVEILEDIT